MQDRWYLPGTLTLGGLTIAAGYLLHLEFVAISLVAMSLARPLGWYLSRHLLYPGPALLAGAMAALWGAVIAIGVGEAIQYFQPSLIIQIIFGYGMGAYLSMPNYGLSSGTEHIMIRRHAVVQNIPLVTFIAFSVGMALH